MLTRRIIILGTFCYAAIIAYGSLVPFQFQPLSISALYQQFSEVCSTPITHVSKSDFLANMLLFVPLGFLLTGSCLFDQPRQGWLLILPVSLVCILFGESIECLQLMFPPRSSSLSDILAQSIGSVSGSLLWILAGMRFTKQVNELTGRMDSSNRLIRFLPVYLLMIVILETVPFDFTLSPVEVVHKWREGRISVIPFAAFMDPDRNMLTKSLWNIVLFLPAGLLIGFSRQIRGLKAALLGLLIAGGVETLQLFVLSRYFEPTDIVTGAFAIWLGWWLLQLHKRFTDDREALLSSNAVLPLLLTAWLLVIVAINWSPFDFTWTGALDRLSTISLVPFADYQQKHYLSAFDDLIHKLLLFVLLGLLLSANPAAKRSALTVACLGGFISTVIEMGQVLLPSRYPSISDIVLGFFASLAGYGLATVLRSAGQPPIQLRVNHQA